MPCLGLARVCVPESILSAEQPSCAKTAYHLHTVVVGGEMGNTCCCICCSADVAYDVAVAPATCCSRARTVALGIGARQRFESAIRWPTGAASSGFLALLERFSSLLSSVRPTTRRACSARSSSSYALSLGHCSNCSSAFESVSRSVCCCCVRPSNQTN